MDSQAMHAHEPPPTRRRHDDSDGYAQDSPIPSPDNEPEPQRLICGGQPIQLVFMADAEFGGFEETRQSATGIMVFADESQYIGNQGLRRRPSGPLPLASMSDFPRETLSQNG